MLVNGICLRQISFQKSLLLKTWVYTYFYAWRPYCLGTRSSRSSYLTVDCLPMFLKLILDSMSKRRVGLRVCGWQPYLSLRINRYRLFWYLLVEYTVHHRKLNYRCQIYITSVSRASVLKIYVVVSEGPQYFAFMILHTSDEYSSVVMGDDGSRSDFLVVLICFRYFLVCESTPGWSWYVPSKI